MARKTHSTRQKMTFRVPEVKPRNPTVAPMHARKAGAHAVTATRTQEKARLRDEVEALSRIDTTTSPKRP